MAEEVKPTAETMSPQPTVTVGPEPVVSNTATTETKKSNKSKIVLIIVALICFCLLCVAASIFILTNFVANTANALNSAITNEMLNSTRNSTDSTTSNSTNDTNSGSTSDENFSFGTDIPAEFPSDVPIYSGAVASFSSANVNDEGNNEVTVTFTVKAPTSDVVNFYKTRMAEAGYEFQGEVTFFGNVLTFENAQREVLVTVLGVDTEEDIILSISSIEK